MGTLKSHTVLALLALTLALATTITTASAPSTFDGGAEDEDYATYMKVLERLAEKVNQDCESVLPEYVCEELEIYGKVEERSPFPSCDACLGWARLIIGLIRLNYTLEDLYDPLIEQCLGFYEGLDGEAMCPGMVDNYGPHQYDILTYTGIDADEYCLITNACRIGDITPELDTKRKEHLLSLGDNIVERITRKFHRKQKTTQDVQKRERKSSGQNTIKVAHVADIHVDLEYGVGSPVDCGMLVCCRWKYPGEGEARQYGDRRCDIPETTVEIAFNRMREEEVDFVLFAGDVNPGVQWEETQEIQLRGSEYLAQTAAALLADHGIPVYPALGNHEMFPGNLYHTGREEIQELNELYADWWDAAADFPPNQRQNLDRYSVYTLELRDGLRLITYNSNYGYTYNWYNLINLFDDDEEDFDDQMDWMASELDEARRMGDKVIVMGHHPTGDSASFVTYSYVILDLMSAYSDVIVLHVQGHYHRDQYKMVWETRVLPGLTPPVGIQYIGTSLTTSRNPGFRVYELDPDTFELIDYKQYFMNLTEVSDLPPSTSHFQLMYEAREEYDLEDLSPQSYMDFAVRMSEDQDLLDRYYQNMYMRDENRVTCDDEDNCRQERLCDIWCPSWNANRACREAGEFPPPGPSCGFVPDP